MTNTEFQKDPNIKYEKMRYNNNSLAYKLGMGGIVFSVIACFIGLNSLQPSSVLTVFIVLLNIAILLFGFLSSEKVKTYTKKYTYYMYALGAACFARIFIYPLMLIIYYQKFIAMVYGPGDFATNYDKASSEFNDILGYTVIGKLVNYGTKDAPQYVIEGTGYLWHNGTFRGILLVVLLGLATTCFVASGLVNQKREKELSQYLLSIGAKR